MFYITQILFPAPPREELFFASDFAVGDDGSITWEHLSFSASGPNAEMVARVLCPNGMLFPLGANLLPYGSPIPKDGADVRANFILDIKLLGPPLICWPYSIRTRT